MLSDRCLGQACERGPVDSSSKRRDVSSGSVERTTTRLLAAPVSLVESVLPAWLTGRS